MAEFPHVLDELLGTPTIQVEGAPIKRSPTINFTGVSGSYDNTNKRINIDFVPGDALGEFYAGIRAAIDGAAVGSIITAKGNAALSDGAGGQWVIDDTGTFTDDGGTILTPGGFGSTHSRAAVRVYSGPVDVRWFGAKGDGTTDNAVAINRAVTACNTAGGGVVFIPAGTFKFNAQITLLNNVELCGAGVGATVLSTAGFAGTVGTAFPNAATIYGSGSVLLLDGLASGISIGATTITLSSDQSAQLAPGDTIFIYDSTDSSFSTYRTYYRAGEFCTVRSVSGAVITLTAPTFAAYATGANRKVYKLQPLRATMRRMSIRGFSATDLVSLVAIKYAAKCDFSDLDMSGTDYAHIICNVGVDIACSNVRIFDTSAAGSGYQYGIVGANVQRMRISDCDINTSRIATDFGGGDYIGAVVNRDCLVSNCVLRTNGLGGTGAANMHGNCEYITYRNCHMKGVYLSGDHSLVENCTIYSGTSDNEAVYVTEPVGADHSVKGCKLIATGNVSSSTGLIAFQGATALTRTGGTFLVADTELYMGSFTGKPWRLQNASGSTNDYNIAFRGVRAACDTAAATNVALITNGSGLGFRNVELRDCVLTNLALDLSALNAQNLFLESVTVTGAASYGILKGANGSAAWSTEYCRASQCVTTGCKNAGILLTGQSQSFSILDVLDCTSLNNATTPVGNATDTSIFANQWLVARVEDCTVGDTQGSPTQTYVLSADSVTTFRANRNNIVGSILATAYSSTNLYNTWTEYDGVSTSPVGGVHVANKSPAAAGAQQYSPGLILTGQGWKTNATAASQQVDFMLQAYPVQGTANPSVNLHFLRNINLAGFASLAHLDSATGDFTVNGNLNSTAWLGNYVQFSAGASFGQIRGGTTIQIVTSADDAVFNLSGGNLILTPGGSSLIEIFGSAETYYRQTIARFKDNGGTDHFVFDCNGDKFGWGVTPAAKPSAYTITNVTTDRSYDANATTVDELADVLGTLIADLKLYGWLQ